MEGSFETYWDVHATVDSVRRFHHEGIVIRFHRFHRGSSRGESPRELTPTLTAFLNALTKAGLGLRADWPSGSQAVKGRLPLVAGVLDPPVMSATTRLG